MYILEDVIKTLEEIAPPVLAEDWDNVGLMIGSRKQKVSKIMCALDINEEVASEAVQNNVQCIVTHHPLLFKPLHKIDFDSSKGSIIKKLICQDISVYAMHTNYDIVRGGINDILCQKLSINNTEVLHISNLSRGSGIGRYGELSQATTLEDFIEKIKQVFKLSYVRVTDTTNRPVKRIAICSGSGGDYISRAAEVADVYITGDIKFHEAQEAKALGLSVIDIGHYASENISISHIAFELNNRLKGINAMCSSVNGEVIHIK